MAYVATWKSGFGSLYKADAQKVSDEISALGEEFTPVQILDKARDPKTELHKCFEWDDTKAAERWRLHQARNIVCNLVIKEREDEPNEGPERRIFHKTGSSDGYKPLTIIMRNQTEYEKLLAACARDLQSLKAKYHSLSEYEEIWALIQ